MNRDTVAAYCKTDSTELVWASNETTNHPTQQNRKQKQPLGKGGESRSSTICYLECPVFNKNYEICKETLKCYPHSGKKGVDKNCPSGPRC